MSDYRYVHRYDIFGYWLIYSISALLACLFIVASWRESIFVLFALVLAVFTGYGIRSILTKATSGVEIRGELLTYWVTDEQNGCQAVDLSEVESIRYKSVDNYVVYLELSNGVVHRMDTRFFADPCDLISAIGKIRKDLTPVCMGGHQGQKV